MKCANGVARNQVVHSILSELNTLYLKQSLMEFPDKIVAMKKRARVLREAVEDADQARAVLEAIMATDIADEVDRNTGKSKFSNEGARKSELLKRKAESAEYQAAQRAARQAQFQLNEVEDELAALMDKFKAVRYVSRMVTAELEFLAGDDLYDEAGDDGGGVESGPTSPEQPY